MGTLFFDLTFDENLIYSPRQPVQSFQLDTDDPPALEVGTTVHFQLRGAWHDGMVVDCESYSDCDRPWATVQEVGFKPALHHLPVADLFDLDDVLDSDPEYHNWLHKLDEADSKWEERK